MNNNPEEMNVNQQDHMNNASLTNESLPVNTNKHNTIVRVVHNRDNPFVQLNKQALWDSNLSLKAVGLWARCMSRPNDWKFSIKELVGKCKEGRRAVDAAMQELIAAGYACRLEYYEKNQQGKFQKGMGGVEYVFFEFPATEEEKLEQLDIFKKSFRDCGFGDRRFSDSRNAHLLIQSSKQTDVDADNTSLKVPEEPAAPEPAKAGDEAEKKSRKKKEMSKFSPKIREVSELMINSLLRTKPDYAVPKNMSAFMTHVDYLLRLDKRDAVKLMDVFNWALADNFWSAKMFKPNPAEYLRSKFDQLEMQMNSKPSDQKKVDRRTKNLDGTPVDAPHLKDLF